MQLEAVAVRLPDAGARDGVAVTDDSLWEGHYGRAHYGRAH